MTAPRYRAGDIIGETTEGGGRLVKVLHVGEDAYFVRHLAGIGSFDGVPDVEPLETAWAFEGCEAVTYLHERPEPEDLPELTREDAVEAMQDMSTDLYRAEDRLAFVREMCDAADREQRQITTEQVRAWTQYTGCGGVIDLSEQQECPLPPSACEARECTQAAPAGPQDVPDPGEVHQQAGGFNGADAWMWRCNGTQWCDGWIGINLGSEQAAQAEYERHARECHGEQPTERQLHARRACPGWEYATTEGPRKQWDDVDRPPSDENGDPDPSWERNVDAGRDGWARFDYTEESYWRRRVVSAGS